jgi:predicted methyltransferase
MQRAAGSCAENARGRRTFNRSAASQNAGDNFFIREAAAAGFRLAGESDALRNPKDPTNIPVFDPKIRFHTSQFALKFRKPVR